MMMKRQSIFDDFNDLYNTFSRGCCNPENDIYEIANKGLTISEDENRLYIDANLPGVNPEDVEVTLDPKKRALAIRGEVKTQRNNVKYYAKNSRSYFYTIPLSNEIDLDGGIEALSKNGVLSVTLLKNKNEQPLKIDVKTSNE